MFSFFKSDKLFCWELRICPMATRRVYHVLFTGFVRNIPLSVCEGKYVATRNVLLNSFAPFPCSKEHLSTASCTYYLSNQIGSDSWLNLFMDPICPTKYTKIHIFDLHYMLINYLLELSVWIIQWIYSILYRFKMHIHFIAFNFQNVWVIDILSGNDSGEQEPRINYFMLC